MRTFLTLDLYGLVVAATIGALILFFGGEQGLFFLFVILEFLVLASIATWLEKGEKQKMKGYESARGWKNVVANGIVPLVISALYFLYGSSFPMAKAFFVVAYVASLAAVTADKFSSEIGVLDPHPIMLLGLKISKVGKSGAVSPLGLVAGLLASSFIAACLFSYHNFLFLFLIVMVSGFFGDLVDSFFGYFEEKGFGNKYMSNILCAMFGAGFGVLLLFVL